MNYKKILMNILAVLAGAVIGGVVNGIIIQYSDSIIPFPEGVNLKTPEGLLASMHLMKPINFLMPFLAHAIGTLVGAIVTALIASNNQLKFALVIGALFFMGGAMMVYQLPSPMWFNILDLVGAYFPMAYAGWFIVKNRNSNTTT